MPKSKITLFTSIPPRLTRPIRERDFGLPWQTACIQSWKDAGFKIVSLNSAKEISVQRSLSPSVEFREIPKGHTRPSITDFFEAAKSCKSEIVGIVNADCMLMPHLDFSKHLMRGFKGVIIAERFNISHKTLRPTGESCRGFDAFFFNVSALASIPHDDHWRIGDVWVDYWLPFAFYLAGFEIKTLPAPILLHLNHELAWAPEAWTSEIRRLTRILQSGGKRQLDPILSAELRRLMPQHDAGAIHDLLFKWLKSRKPLWKPEIGGVDDLMTSLINSSAIFPQPRYRIVVHHIRSLPRYARTFARRVIDGLGLRRALFALGLVKRQQTSS